MKIDETKINPDVVLHNHQVITNMEEARKGKKTVAFVGMAATTRDRAPWDDPNVEIWGLGRSWRDTKIKDGKPSDERWLKRISRYFEIHPKEFLHLDNKPYELHSEWLREKHDFPIYMDDVYPEFPSSVRYPIEWAVETFGRRFTSSMSYMWPIAHRDGFDRIELYGFEMGMGGEYAFQLPEVCYHIGWFCGVHGRDSVFIQPDSHILRAPLYAYEEMYNPILTSLEQRIRVLGGGLAFEEKIGSTFIGGLGALKDLQEKLPGIEYSPVWKELKEEYTAKLRDKEHKIASIRGSLNDNKVLKDAVYYMLPASYKYNPKDGKEVIDEPVGWDEVDLPWKEAENVTETREES
jgi:hypothetical protein